MKADPLPRLVHSTEDIQAALRRGQTPVTDNRNGLIQLGFQPVVPEGSDPCDSVWERSADSPHRAAGGLRMLVRERAVLVEMTPHAA